MTDAAIRETVNRIYADEDVVVSKGVSVGLRMVPTVRDLQFAWEEMPQQVLDEQQEKMRSSVRAALTNWARSSGRSDRLHRQPATAVHASCRSLVRSAKPVD